MMSKKTVSLEELIRLKRAERPPAEFWAEFDRELRAKQLAAIVEPRPWWAPLIKVGVKISHYQLPVGAAAILALSFITIREYRTVEAGAAYVPETEAAAAVPSSLPQTVESVVAAPQLAVVQPTAARMEAVSVATTSASADTAMSFGRASHSMPLQDPAPAQVEPTPSARYIAANLAAAQAVDPRIVDDVFGMPVRATESRQPVRDPLAQISAPGESRRSRLLEPALPVAASANVAVGTSDRVARRLTEERLYDTISRIGLKGDRVAFKF